jgi:hypothetical protein
MSILLVRYDPIYIRLLLAALVILIVAGYLLYRMDRTRRARQARSQVPSHPPAPVPVRPQLFWQFVRPRSSILGDVMRGLLILLAFYVAAGFTLILLPEGAVDRMAQMIRLRNGEPAQQEATIALLYLGDEVQDKEFHIRGVIRNISTQPIEKLDATVRLYAPDGSLQETTVVRMDSEAIAPDAIASFNLTHTEYSGQIGSYTVDFKLRQGQIVSYKDMRGSHADS